MKKYDIVKYIGEEGFLLPKKEDIGIITDTLGNTYSVDWRFRKQCKCSWFEEKELQVIEEFKWKWED